MRQYKLVILLLLAMSALAAAQVSQTAVQFLLIAPGARAGGMGETFIAISDDATAVHWNPAGLGRYPLTASWLDFNSAPGDTIQSLSMVKNNLPENNYRQYDLWSIINGHLTKWDGAHWVAGTLQPLRAGASLESVIMRYTGLGENEAAPYIDKLARANNTIMPETMDSLKTEIMAALPQDYLYKEDLQYGFEKLHKAWLQLRINVKGFSAIRNDINNVLADSIATTDEMDKVTFGFDRGIEAKGDREVWLPYDLTLPDKINCLNSDEEILYLGTNNGLYRFDPQKSIWSFFTVAKDSLPSDNITAIEKGSKKMMYIGTSNGLVKFTGRNITKFPPNSDVPTGQIDAIAASSDRDAWLASDGILYHYDGAKWSQFKEKELSIGESIPKVVEKFYGEIGTVMYDTVMSMVTAYNSTKGDTTQTGKPIKLPYNLGYRGKITALGVDERYRLWIGTTYGVSLFTGDDFKLFGYKIYQAPESTSVQSVAAQYITDRDPQKIELLSSKIRQFNGLESDQINSGKKLLVYSNSLGSEIKAIRPITGKKVAVATSYGAVEYDNGKWSRIQNLDIARSNVSNIYAKSGDMWFASPKKVSVYAAAKKQVTFMHSNYLVQLASDLYYDFFSIVYPTADWGTFGFGVHFISYGEQLRTNENNLPEGSFTSYDIAFTVSYGTNLMNNLYGGLSVRYINSHLSVVGAGAERGKGVGYSLAVDAGVIYDMTRRLTLAATVTNLGPDIAYIDADQADPLPRKLALGFAYKLIDSPFNKLTVLGEATKLLVDLNHSVKTEIEEIIPHIGIEYWYSNYVALRAGYVYDKIGVQKYFTLGTSLQYSSYRFDFSYIPASSEETNRLANTMRFSMNVGF